MLHRKLLNLLKSESDNLLKSESDNLLKLESEVHSFFPIASYSLIIIGMTLETLNSLK